MTPMRLFALALLVCAPMAFAPVGAQETFAEIDESRVIIPRPKILRVPSANDVAPTTDAANAETGVQTDPTVPGGIEERPLEPLAGSSSGGGLVPSATERVALQADPEIRNILEQERAEREQQSQVRVIRPGQDGDAAQEDSNGRGLIRQAAVTTETQADTGPRWQRERTRRFKLAPKGTDETEGLLDSKGRPYAVPLDQIDTDIKGGARLRQLDKMTGQTVTYDLTNGETRKVDRLLVSLEGCRSPENNGSHGAMAFLKIWDTRNLQGKPDFTGWMFAESPALSALDHPRYDLWVISCTTSAAEVSTGNE